MTTSLSTSRPLSSPLVLLQLAMHNNMSHALASLTRYEEAQQCLDCMEVAVCIMEEEQDMIIDEQPATAVDEEELEFFFLTMACKQQGSICRPSNAAAA
eukprot:CAMPEP_0172470136 /NCGR_PEP_ID=MMETSP1065-20121228/65570_1 /TAXON_ID=265537 /ORGANISM="Amphiprora paludosa, Strain CCMP125" /LENGTH=98 /DNA_ID=CAMNT_0013227987 /DNA_START=158 /DNA_END=454 /DNA_ORIENTATION=-